MTVVALVSLAAWSGRCRWMWVVPAVVWHATGSWMAALVLADLMGWAALFDRQRRGASMRRRRRSLPEFAETVARGLEQGHPLADATRDAASAHRSLADGVGTIVSALDGGRELDPAHLKTALGPGSSVVIAAIDGASRHREGGVGLLRSAAATARARRLRGLDIDAQAANARASMMLMAIIPWAALGLGLLAGEVRLPDHAPLLVTGVSLSLLGTTWSSLLVARVEAES